MAGGNDSGLFESLGDPFQLPSTATPSAPEPSAASEFESLGSPFEAASPQVAPLARDIEFERAVAELDSLMASPEPADALSAELRNVRIGIAKADIERRKRDAEAEYANVGRYLDGADLPPINTAKDFFKQPTADRINRNLNVGFDEGREESSLWDIAKTGLTKVTPAKLRQGALGLGGREMIESSLSTAFSLEDEAVRGQALDEIVAGSRKPVGERSERERDLLRVAGLPEDAGPDQVERALLAGMPKFDDFMSRVDRRLQGKNRNVAELRGQVEAEFEKESAAAKSLNIRPYSAGAAANVLASEGPAMAFDLVLGRNIGKAGAPALAASRGATGAAGAVKAADDLATVGAGASMYGRAYTMTYNDSLRDGMSPEAAGERAAAHAAFEAIPEMLPIGMILKVRPGKGVARRFIDAGLSEGAAESATALLQSGYDHFNVEGKEITLGDLLDNMGQAFFGGAVLGTAMRGGTEVADAITGRRKAAEAEPTVDEVMTQIGDRYKEGAAEDSYDAIDAELGDIQGEVEGALDEIPVDAPPEQAYRTVREIMTAHGIAPPKAPRTMLERLIAAHRTGRGMSVAGGTEGDVGEIGDNLRAMGAPRNLNERRALLEAERAAETAVQPQDAAPAFAPKRFALLDAYESDRMDDDQEGGYLENLARDLEGKSDTDHRSFNPDHHTMADAVAMFGGIDGAHAGGEFDIKTLNKGRVGKPVIRAKGKGLTPDGMAEALTEAGFRTRGGQPIDPNSLSEMLDDESRGGAHWSTHKQDGDYGRPVANTYAGGSPKRLAAIVRKYLAGGDLGENQRKAVSALLESAYDEGRLGRVKGQQRIATAMVSAGFAPDDADAVATIQQAYEEQVPVEDLEDAILESGGFIDDLRTTLDKMATMRQQSPEERALDSIKGYGAGDAMTRAATRALMGQVADEQEAAALNRGNYQGPRKGTGQFAQPYRKQAQDAAKRAADVATAEGIKPESAAKMFEALFPRALIDAVTGFYKPEDRYETMQRAADYVGKAPVNAFYVEVDLSNLGGLNKKMGNSEANVAYRRIAKIISNRLSTHLAKNNPSFDQVNFRHGGDEMSFFVFGENLDHSSIEDVLRSAQEVVWRYARDIGVHEIPHAKHENDPTRIGVNFYFGVSEVQKNKTPEATFKEADKTVEDKKEEPSYGYRKREAARAARPDAGATGSQDEGDPGRGGDLPVAGVPGRGEAQERREEGGAVGAGRDGDEVRLAAGQEGRESALDGEREGRLTEAAPRNLNERREREARDEELTLAQQEAPKPAPKPQEPQRAQTSLIPEKTPEEEAAQRLKDFEAEKEAKKKEQVKRAERLPDGPLFDGSQNQTDIESVDLEEAGKILEAAGIEGKDRLDSIAKVRRGEYTLDDLRAAFPQKKQAKADEPQAAEKKPAKVTPQIASDRQLAGMIAIAADSIGELRAVDVDRVLSEAPAHFRLSLAQHIKSKRKDLAAAVDEAMEDTASEGMAETEKPEAPQQDRIDDFGEKIGGARKDVWTSFKDSLGAVADGDIASQPLSKVWPEPDYQALLDSGVDPWAVAFARAARDEIPSKPRKSWRVKGWSEQVRLLRETTTRLIDGTYSVPDTKRRMSEFSSKGMSDLSGRIELYALVGHRQSLEGVRIRYSEYSLRNGINYNPPRGFWVVEKEVAATAFSNWPRELAEGNTKEEALAAFKEKYDSLVINPPAKKEVGFDVYSKRGEEGYWVGKKIGRNPVFLAGPFDSLKEARGYKENNQEELSEKLAKFKEIPRERRDTNEPRVGEDMRNGQDVTPQMFAEAFGFRGVEFGNWVEQGRRQQDLNRAYDALMDMAAILGIPAKAISLNGELGLAFGARGSGGKNAAAAHYEPGRVVINLTKKEGAGSLGHEWFHALDNYFSRMRSEPEGGMTEAKDVSLAARGSKFVHQGAVRKEMVEAFGAVMKSIRETAMRARSSRLDAKKTKEYWTTGREMAARAFESYLISKLQDQSASNDYLANIVDEATWKAAESLGFELDDSYPYPTAGEVPAIRAGFDALFQTIQTRETDAGVAMFSLRNAGKKPVGLSRQEAQRLLNQHDASVKAVQSYADLDPEIRAEAERQGAKPSDIKGVHWRGKSWVIADNVTADEVARVALHEGMHGKLRQAYGREVENKMAVLASSLPGVRKPSLRVLALAESQGISLSEYVKGLNKDATKTDRQKLAILTEELLTHVEEGRATVTGKLKAYLEAVVGAIRAFFRKHGFAEFADYGITDIQHLLRQAREYGEQIEMSGEVPAFMVAWHGTPYEFDAFSLEHMGKGEGAQAYGWGLYFAGKREIADWYRKTLAEGRVLLDGQPADGRTDIGMAARLIADGLSGGKTFAESKTSISAQYEKYRDDSLREAEGLAKRVGEPPARGWGTLTIEESDVQQQRDRAAYYDAKLQVLKSLTDGRVTVEKGQLYKVDIPEDGEYLLWDKPVPEETVRKIAEHSVERGLVDDADEAFEMLADEYDVSGAAMYRGLSDQVGGDEAASKFLNEIGIPGIKYLDGTSRGAGDGSYNYVIFDDAAIKILDREQGPAFSRREGDPEADTPRFSIAPGAGLFDQDVRYRTDGKPWANRKNADARDLLGDRHEGVMLQIESGFRDDPRFQEVRGRYGINNLSRKDRADAADEFVARLAESGVLAAMAKEKPLGPVGRLFRAVRDAQQGAGAERMEDADIERLLARSVDALNRRRAVDAGAIEQGQRPASIPLFSLRTAGNESRSDQSTLNQIQDDIRQTHAVPESRGFIDRARDAYKRLTDWNGLAVKQGLIDSMAAIGALEVGKNGGLLDASDSAYKAALMTKNLSGVMATTLYEKQVAFDGKWFSIDDESESFLGIFEPLTKEPGLLRLWEHWAGAVRAKRLLAEGREHNYTEEQIDRVLAFVSERPALKGMFNETHRRWRDFNRRTLDMAEAAGVIDPAGRALWASDDYVPFHRVMEEQDEIRAGGAVQGLSGQKDGIRRLRGGEGKVSILESMMLNTMHLVDASYKNVAMQKVIDLADGIAVERMDMEWKPQKFSDAELAAALRKHGISVDSMTAEQREAWSTMFTRTAPQGNDIVSVLRNGKREWYQVNDPLLLRSLTAIGPDRYKMWLKVLGMPKSWLTTMVTADPGFMIANFVRDTLSTWAVVNPKGLPGEYKTSVLTDAVRGGVKSFANNKAQWAVMAAGAGNEGHYSVIPHDIRLGMAKINSMSSTLNAPAKTWAFWQRVGRSFEYANRLAVYENVKKAGGSEAEAAFQAMDVLNFTRRGDWAVVHFLTSVVPFMNARIQGLDRLYRGAKESPAAFAMKGAGFLMASMALMALNDDDERYWDLPEWDRDTYWHFWVGDEHFRVPKPFEVGAIFGTIPERIYGQMKDHEDSRVIQDAILRMVVGTFAINPIPQAFMPAAEAIVNRSAFKGQPIVGYYMDGFARPEDQYDPWTSESARALAEAMPDLAPDFMRSPKKIEHMVRGYAGTLGGYLLMGSDHLARWLGDYPEAPDAPVAQMPVVGRFWRQGETSTKYANEFYEMLRDISQTNNQIKAYSQQGMIQEARGVLVDNRLALSARDGMNKVASEMAEIRREIQRIHYDQVKSGEQKRKEIELLHKKRNELAKFAVKRYGGIAQ